MSYDSDNGYDGPDTGDSGNDVNDETELPATEVTEDEELPAGNPEDEELPATEETEVTEEVTTTEVNEENTETNEAVRAEINEKSPYSSDVNDYISSTEELEVYTNAGLVEKEVNGRTCLVREDFDPNYVDPKTGKTNAELIAMDRSPIDPKTGDKIQLHHMKQDPNGPLAELTAKEHRNNYSSLHTSKDESWRHDTKLNSDYNNNVRPGHWRARSN